MRVMHVYRGDTSAFVFEARWGGQAVVEVRISYLVTAASGSWAKGAKQVYAVSVRVDDPAATFLAYLYWLVQPPRRVVRLVHRGPKSHKSLSLVT